MSTLTRPANNPLLLSDFVRGKMEIMRPNLYTLSRRRNVYGEYVVRAYYCINGLKKRLPDCDYYTSDWEDAQDTLELVLASLR